MTFHLIFSMALYDFDSKCTYDDDDDDDDVLIMYSIVSFESHTDVSLYTTLNTTLYKT